MEQRLIDANALIQDMETVCSATQFGRLTAKMCIKRAPTIDPVKHGKWINGTQFGGVRCSECGYGTIIMLHYSNSYCPSCGARMDGEV